MDQNWLIGWLLMENARQLEECSGVVVDGESVIMD
jgi:hypothetical protein